jgi:hypothetical protein
MKVSVHYLFSRRDLIGSKLISYGTRHLYPEFKNTPSHVAILVNDRWVHESTLDTGVRVMSYEKWLELNEEVAKVACPIEWEYEDIKNLFRSIQDKKYDWLGVIYLGLWMIPSKLFNVKIPEHNAWENPNKYFCSEVMGYMLNSNYDMKPPVEVLKELHGKNNI